MFLLVALANTYLPIQSYVSFPSVYVGVDVLCIYLKDNMFQKHRKDTIRAFSAGNPRTQPKSLFLRVSLMMGRMDVVYYWNADSFILLHNFCQQFRASTHRVKWWVIAKQTASYVILALGYYMCSKETGCPFRLNIFSHECTQHI